MFHKNIKLTVDKATRLNKRRRENRNCNHEKRMWTRKQNRYLQLLLEASAKAVTDIFIDNTYIAFVSSFLLAYSGGANASRTDMHLRVYARTNG